MAKELNVLALIKGEDRFVYVYDDTSKDALVSFLQTQAADPGLAINWFDTVVLTKKAEEQLNAAAALASATPRF